MFNSPFKVQKTDYKVVFVQDFLLSDLVGGAELSMDALHRSAPVPILVVRSHEITQEIITKNVNAHWVFGNFANLHPAVVNHFIQSGLSYSVYEHDYKFCLYRSIEKHELESGAPCNCHIQQIGKFISIFYENAKQVWFCSEDHMRVYFDRFSNLDKSKCEVLSACFGEEFFNKIAGLIDSLPNRKKSGWLTLDSESWIKGTSDAIKWLEENKKSYKLIKNLTPDQVLEKMASAEGFVCLPRGYDVSNRMVTEAKLLGCEVVTNDKIQHAKEEWLNNPDKKEVLNWLYGRRSVFWKKTMRFVK